MKITIITSPFGCIPPDAIGAIEKRWYNTSKIFVEKGHTVNFISKKPNKIVDDKIVEEGININFQKGYDWKKSQISNLILDFIYSFKALFLMPKTDVLILNTFFSPILSRFFRHKFKKTVYNVARFPKGQFKYYQNIDRLSCVSYAVYNELIKQTPSVLKQAKTIPNPVDVSSFNFHELQENKEFTIMYTGRVHPEKGLDILASAYKELVQENSNITIKLIIVGATTIAKGGGGDEYLKIINEAAGQENKIIYIDPIYNPIELSNKMLEADVYCYPSIAEKGETFGVAPLEAMALGLPVVVSNLDCFKDFVNDGENAIIFDHRNDAIHNLKIKLQEILNNFELRKKLGKNASITAKSFSTEKIASLYLSDFKKLLNA